MKIKKNFAIEAETDYEIRRLAKLWKIPIAQAWERCCHYAAVRANERNSDVISEIAELRQAEAKVEMLKVKDAA